MQILELILVATGLSMDALAVSICKGLSVSRVQPKHALAVGLYFGGFQALMPLIGYLLGIRFQTLISAFDHWIAFILLALIGVNMIRESRSDDEDAPMDAAFGPRAMLPLAVATSIDALAIGVTFAFLDVSIVPAVVLIGCITCAISAGGIYLGRVVGERFQSHAEAAGGIVLVLLGVKILLEHLGFLGA